MMIYEHNGPAMLFSKIFVFFKTFFDKTFPKPTAFHAAAHKFEFEFFRFIFIFILLTCKKASEALYME